MKNREAGPGAPDQENKLTPKEAEALNMKFKFDKNLDYQFEAINNYSFKNCEREKTAK